jgi:hypothetical protein
MAVENMTLAPYLANQRSPYNYAKIEQIDRDIVTSWLTLDEITQQLNLFQDESQDQYLEGLEVAVRMAIEDYLGVSLFSTTYRTYYADPGLANTAVFLDLPEASPGSSGVTINSVSYYLGTNNAAQTVLPATSYYFDPTGNRVVIPSLPSPLAQNIANPVQCEFTVNANFVAQYPVVKQAGLLLFTHLYNNRSDTTVDKLKEIPFGVKQLLRPYKPLVM